MKASDKLKFTYLRIGDKEGQEDGLEEVFFPDSEGPYWMFKYRNGATIACSGGVHLEYTEKVTK